MWQCFSWSDPRLPIFLLQLILNQCSSPGRFPSFDQSPDSQIRSLHANGNCGICVSLFRSKLSTCLPYNVAITEYRCIRQSRAPSSLHCTTVSTVRGNLYQLECVRMIIMIGEDWLRISGGGVPCPVRKRIPDNSDAKSLHLVFNCSVIRILEGKPAYVYWIATERRFLKPSVHSTIQQWRGNFVWLNDA